MVENCGDEISATLQAFLSAIDGYVTAIFFLCMLCFELCKINTASDRIVSVARRVFVGQPETVFISDNGQNYFEKSSRMRNNKYKSILTPLE